MVRSPENVILGIGGSIAAYKAAEIVRGFRKVNVDVTVAMTRNAARFITPLTLQTLSGNRVLTDPWKIVERADIEHIELARRTGCFLVAPATADLIAKFAHGIADDFLSTLYLALQCPILIAPAMNRRMFAHPATRANLEILKERSVDIIAPDSGYLACQEEGPGRLADPPRIVARVLELLGGKKSLAGKKILVTAGPTREAIDPIRYLSNLSSGRMGYCLANEAAIRGAEVILISGPTELTQPRDVRLVQVVTAEEMRAAVFEHLGGVDVVFQVAAVADFRPHRVLPEKWKRSGGVVPIELESTPDILAEIAGKKSGAFLVGFAAETEKVLENAGRKLKEKGLDLIVACDVTQGGLGNEEAAMSILDSDGPAEELPRMRKEEIAAHILDRVERRLN